MVAMTTESVTMGTKFQYLDLVLILVYFDIDVNREYDDKKGARGFGIEHFF